MGAPETATLTYKGTVPEIGVSGYGHFHPDESKVVDYSTAVQFDCEPCKNEGWEVSFSSKKETVDTESKSSSDLSPRGIPSSASKK